MGGHLASFTGWHWTIDVRLALMLICLGIATWLAALCWRYRPQWMSKPIGLRMWSWNRRREPASNKIFVRV